MKVIPTNQSVAERHVQFSEFVQVREYVPTPTGSTVIEPSMHAQRLEHEMRTAKMSERQSQVPTTSRPAKVYKAVCEKAALVCGASVIPAFALALLGPIWLVVPAALFVAMVALTLMRGKPTQEILEEQAKRASNARLSDSQV